MKINFLEICQPEYFAGHYLPLIHIPVNGATTKKDLFEVLEKQFEKDAFECALGEAFREIEELQKTILSPSVEGDDMHVYFTIQYLQK